jgi:hypothetical protein
LAQRPSENTRPPPGACHTPQSAHGVAPPENVCRAHIASAVVCARWVVVMCLCCHGSCVAMASSKHENVPGFAWGAQKGYGRAYTWLGGVACQGDLCHWSGHTWLGMGCEVMTVGGKCHWTRLTLVRCTVEAKNASALARLDVYSHVIACWVVWHVVRRQSASVSVDQC